MLSKPNTFAVVAAASFCFFVAMDAQTSAQAPPGTPGAPTMAPGTQNRILGEAETAFEKKEYATTITKLKELLTALGPKKEPNYETLYFYLGLANLLSDQYPAAEAAFDECAKAYPQGECTTRCYLGIGRACILQDTPEKKQQAIEALKKAALDPKYRSEAGLWLGQVYIDLKKPEEALTVFRSLMGSDVRSPQQTAAAIEVIGLLADTGKADDLVAYLDRLSHQPGIRDAMAFFVNQIIVRGDELVGNKEYDGALTIYRAVPPLSQILEIQNAALAAMRKDQAILERVINAEKDKPVAQHSNAVELLNTLKPGIELAESATKAVEAKTDLDAALLMRRGRCLYYLERFEEALVCFRALRTKYKSAPDVEHAFYAEIVILSKLKNIPEIKDKCQQFMAKYPDSIHIEQVTALAVDVLVESKEWKEVRSFCAALAERFPKSESLETYIFYQGVAFFMEGNLKESTPIFTKFLKDFPQSERTETAMYYMAMSCFLSNKYKETLAACKAYLTKFPDGYYAGDMHYRLSFIDFNDKDDDQSDKIIRELGDFVQNHAKDAASGSIYCLLADTYKKKKINSKADPETQNKEIQANEDAALKAYMDAVKTDSLDDIMQYALDSATAIMQRRREWQAIADMHADFMKRKPDSQLFLLSAGQIARMYAREENGYDKAAGVLAEAMEPRISDPTSEQVEFLIDELVKTLISSERKKMQAEKKKALLDTKDAPVESKDAPPEKKKKDIDLEAVDKQLVETLNKITAKKQNLTTAARTYYARARLAQALKDTRHSDLYLKGIATSNATDPTPLSPKLLSVCGDILLKNGDLDGAELMFKRLVDRYHDGMFSDAGPVGLGYIALARKQPEAALKIFDDTLLNNNGMASFKETTLGKLQALVELERYEPAEVLAKQIESDRSFRGETAAKAYLLQGQACRQQAAKEASQTSDKAREFLKQAHAYYQRVYVAYRGFPDICAEAYWQAYQTAKALGDLTLASKTLKALLDDPKLQNTLRFKDAAKEGK
ncbi:MAG: tetratricopeptide repeat protein [Verrucomicrobiota bacterium]